VGWAEIITGTALAVVLFGVAGFTLWLQMRTLRQLPQRQLPDEEMRYLRWQAWRRLATSGLLLLLAILFVIALAFQGNPAQQLADEQAAAREAGEELPLTPEQKRFARIWGWNWIAILLALFLIVLLVAIDFWSIRRYGLRERRKLNEDRRAMMQRQLHRMRQEHDERN
jgi:hypothetical protein